MNNNDNICMGCTGVSEDAVIKIAVNTINEIDGVSCSKSRRGMFGKSSVSLKLCEGTAEITAAIDVEYGKKALHCAELVQNSVKESIQNMTGITVSKVNVLVSGLTEKQVKGC